jgi:hypothetical protein
MDQSLTSDHTACESSRLEDDYVSFSHYALLSSKPVKRSGPLGFRGEVQIGCDVHSRYLDPGGL